MEKFPQSDINEPRDGFVVGESGEATPAQFKSLIQERNEKFYEKLVGSKPNGSLRSKRVSSEHVRRLPEDVVLRPIEKGPKIKFLKEGDSVQWKNASADQWEKPRKIKGFSSDGEYAFFEESATGIPTNELHIWDTKE